LIPTLPAGTEGAGAPSDLLEVQLLRIWEEVLGQRPVGVQDNFFDLGGHSLLITEIQSKLIKQFDKKVMYSKY